VRILALVPARGGSKRLPGKNLKVLAGKPLLAWSIHVAQGIREICDVLVSTDAPAIADVARGAGGLVPWLRPGSLATDEATSADVCLHALDWYENTRGPVDGLLLLQPTSPLRRRSSVLRGIEMFRTRGQRPVIGVSPARSHPLWCFRLEGETMRPFIQDNGLELRSQDLPPAYAINGALYLVTPGHLRKGRSFYSTDMVPLTMDKPGEDIDIDTEWDWRLAEATLAVQVGEDAGLRQNVTDVEKA
jgi:CMP-N,N'-diacetyllegionaminic acid synthase